MKLFHTTLAAVILFVIYTIGLLVIIPLLALEQCYNWAIKHAKKQPYT